MSSMIERNISNTFRRLHLQLTLVQKILNWKKLFEPGNFNNIPRPPRIGMRGARTESPRKEGISLPLFAEWKSSTRMWLW